MCLQRHLTPRAERGLMKGDKLPPQGLSSPRGRLHRQVGVWDAAKLGTSVTLHRDSWTAITKIPS